MREYSVEYTIKERDIGDVSKAFIIKGEYNLRLFFDDVLKNENIKLEKVELSLEY